MSSVRIASGETEAVIVEVFDQLGVELTGKSDIKASVWRISDAFFLDWSDWTFKDPATVIQKLQALAEVSAAHNPGEYRINFNTSSIVNPVADDSYQIKVIQDPKTDAANLPLSGEVKVGQWVDDLLSKGFIVLQSYAFDPVGDTLVGQIWIEESGLVVPAPSSVSVTWYDEDGVAQFTETDSSPDAQGVFKITKASPGLSVHKSYYAKATVVKDSVNYSGVKGAFTVG